MWVKGSEMTNENWHSCYNTLSLHQNMLYENVCATQKDVLVLGLKGPLLNNVLKTHILYTEKIFNHFTIEA